MSGTDMKLHRIIIGASVLALIVWAVYQLVQS